MKQPSVRTITPEAWISEEMLALFSEKASVMVTLLKNAKFLSGQEAILLILLPDGESFTVKPAREVTCGRQNDPCF